MSQSWRLMAQAFHISVTAARTMTDDELRRQVRRPRLAPDERAVVQREILRRVTEKYASMSNEQLLEAHAWSMKHEFRPQLEFINQERAKRGI
jgi:hypothetical protein